MIARKALILFALLPPGAAIAQDRGLASTHQPIVTEGRASVPNCPDWSSQGRDSAAKFDSNYGCAVNSNLAAMIANPDDLVHGREYDGAGAETASRAIKVWRDTAPTGKNGIDKVSSKGGS